LCDCLAQNKHVSQPQHQLLGCVCERIVAGELQVGRAQGFGKRNMKKKKGGNGSGSTNFLVK